MENIEIQTLAPTKWQEYKELRLRAMKTEPQAFLSSHEREVNFPDNKWQERLEAVGNGRSWAWFARNADGKLVGMIGAYRNEEDLKDHSAEIWGVYVDSEMRGRGIAGALMEKILEELKKDVDIKTVHLEVNTDQESAKKLYEKFGFCEEGTSAYKLGDGKEHQISRMEKSIKD